jgi:CheY-like chemotaxis protein
MNICYNIFVFSHTHIMSKRVLIADDDSMLLQLLRLKAEQSDLAAEIHTAESGEEAIQAIKRTQPHILVLDLRMQKGDGFSVLEHLKTQNVDMQVIVLTNYNKPEYREKCTHYGVHEYIVKSETGLNQLMDKLEAYAGA